MYMVSRGMSPKAISEYPKLRHRSENACRLRYYNYRALWDARQLNTENDPTLRAVDEYIEAHSYGRVRAPYERRPTRTPQNRGLRYDTVARCHDSPPLTASTVCALQVNKDGETELGLEDEPPVKGKTYRDGDSTILLLPNDAESPISASAPSTNVEARTSKITVRSLLN
jgi:hypothetical protein